jgi:hypothetical protein
MSLIYILILDRWNFIGGAAVVPPNGEEGNGVEVAIDEEGLGAGGFF